MKIRLHDPVIISQSPPNLRNWGPWQFPSLHRMEAGRVLVEFHKLADSATSYGRPKGQSVSDDEGVTWSEVTSPEIRTGLQLPNGDLLHAFKFPSRPIAGLKLPEPLACVPFSYKPHTFTYYRWTELPVDLRRGWGFRRRSAGSSMWVEEQAQVEVPDTLVRVMENVFVFPFFEQNRIHVGPDGRLVATLYHLPQINGSHILVRRCLAMLVESLDNGQTWHLKSTIPFRPDVQADPLWDARDGFTEPQIGFLPDGSVLALLRTTDGNGVGPLYITRSQDGGNTWALPRMFDSLGVWPQILILKCGVTLVSYGRPGLFLRATDDPAARKWGKRLTLVPPGTLHQDTCSYSALLALTDRQALIAYTDFNVPDKEGRPCKSLLARRIEVC